MASPDPYDRRNITTPPSIPLQNLNRPPDEDDDRRQGGTAQHGRTLSDRGRNLLRNRESISLRGHWNTQYAPIAEGSPSPTRVVSRPHLNTSLTTGQGSTTHREDATYSPVEDASAFQAAIGFAGLSFQGEPSQSPTAQTPPSITRNNPPPLLVHNDSDPYLPGQESEEQGYFSPVYEDTARLTDERHLQPISGMNPSTPNAQRDRSSFQSVRFLTPDAASPASRLGDDLHNAEAGIRSSGGLGNSGSRKRSLSPSSAESPLHRAGTIMRNISQRVVNISNESDPAERTIRRKSWLKQARLEEPPSFPAMPEYLHDGVSSAGSPIKKPPSPVERRRAATNWQPQPNPLRGNTLGIFPPDNKLRLKFCDLLVHPVTEPFLLILIVIQTVLLAVDSSRDVFIHGRSKRWGTSWIDYCLLGLFVIYTVEIVVRVIVSGFIINPVEYSTINRQVGLKEAVLSKGRALFAPQRQPSLKRTASTFGPQQPSILRSFTSGPDGAEQPGHSRQQQRIRLAHRAYLRHSFNRLDFLAVVSFWIAFIIGVFGVESSSHLYVFRMLSCLRILRLLGLTSGTSVGTDFQSLYLTHPSLI